MSIFLRISNEWIKMPSNNNLAFVIRPGAGTFKNKIAYEKLESRYKVVYFADSGGEYDNYPDNWENNANVSCRGHHLGGIVELVKNYIENTNQIPSVIITGSRGGQVTLGKIWESLWRGPSIIINAGCLTTNTIIPKQEDDAMSTFSILRAGRFRDFVAYRIYALNLRLARERSHTESAMTSRTPGLLHALPRRNNSTIPPASEKTERSPHVAVSYR